MKIFINLLVVTLVFAVIVFCARSSDNFEKAKQIMEKSFKKYRELTDRDNKNLKSFIAKASIKGSGELPMGGNESKMPMTLDAIVEIFVVKPRNFYFDISGNLGNAKIIMTEEDVNTMTIILPDLKQFASISLAKQISQQTQKSPQEPDRIEKFFQTMNLEYLGMEKTKPGKAHKILISSKDSKEKSTITAYILDKEWDPARFEIAGGDGGLIAVDFEKLEFNAKIPDSKFVPETAGYTKVNNQQITNAIMMQMMSSMMQKNQE